MANTFEFTVDEVNLILEALQELPFKRSASLVTRIVNEFNAQNAQTTAAAGAIQAALDSGAATIVPNGHDNKPLMPPPNRKDRRAAGKRNGARA